MITVTYRSKPSKSGESILNDFPYRIRHISESPNGQIIFSTDSGHFYRLR